MKTKNKPQIVGITGIDKRIPAPQNSTFALENFAYDAQTKTWHNFIGFEEFFHRTNRPYGSAVDQIYTDHSIDSIYMYQRHNSAQQILLYEQNGSLFRLDKTSGIGASSVPVELQDDRQIPERNEPHTSYTPYGKYVVITNGKDGPIKYRGGDTVFSLGWDYRPDAPEVITPATTGSDDPYPTYIEAASNLQLGQDEIGFNSFFKDSAFQGVGDPTAEGENKYRYKVSFVNEAGSESPISEPSPFVEWETKELVKGTNTYVNRACPVMSIPTGPDGVMARRIYRSTNDSKDFFFHSQIDNNVDLVFTDFKDDTELGAAAPLDSDSIVMPARGARFSATFKGCLFLDGGQLDPTRLYFSQPLQPDTFKDTNYFEIGTREGGDITGMETYYNSLLIFREQAIELVRGDPLNGFELVPFITGIGCSSPHAIVNVPQAGIMFLSQDGIYRLFGGLDGGADLRIEKMSDPIQEIFERISLDKLPAAVGIYSNKWREVHFYVGVDDGHVLDLGIVYHLDSQSFSTRNNRSYQVKCITTDRDANLIYGMYFDTDPQVNQVNKGIYVISGYRREGTQNIGTDESPNYVDGNKPLSKLQSAWLDFGAPFIKKQVKYLYLYVLTTGNQVPSVEVYKDRNWQEGFDTNRALMQRPDHFYQVVYTPVDEGLEDSEAVWGTARWNDMLLTEVRYPVDMKSVSEFAFEIQTDEPLRIMGYAVEYNIFGTETIKGRPA